MLQSMNSSAPAHTVNSALPAYDSQSELLPSHAQDLVAQLLRRRPLPGDEPGSLESRVQATSGALSTYGVNDARSNSNRGNSLISSASEGMLSGDGSVEQVESPEVAANSGPDGGFPASTVDPPGKQQQQQQHPASVPHAAAPVRSKLAGDLLPASTVDLPGKQQQQYTASASYVAAPVRSKLAGEVVPASTVDPASRTLDPPASTFDPAGSNQDAASSTADSPGTVDPANSTVHPAGGNRDVASSTADSPSTVDPADSSQDAALKARHMSALVRASKLAGIFSSADTMAVLSSLDESLQPLLHSLLFGEGVMNDATSIVLLRSMRDLPDAHPSTLLRHFWLFLKLFVLSLLTGVGCGLLSALIAKRAHPNPQKGR